MSADTERLKRQLEDSTREVRRLEERAALPRASAGLADLLKLQRQERQRIEDELHAAQLADDKKQGSASRRRSVSKLLIAIVAGLATTSVPWWWPLVTRQPQPPPKSQPDSRPTSEPTEPHEQQDRPVQQHTLQKLGTELLQQVEPYRESKKQPKQSFKCLRVQFRGKHLALRACLGARTSVTATLGGEEHVPPSPAATEETPCPPAPTPPMIMEVETATAPAPSFSYYEININNDTPSPISINSIAPLDSNNGDIDKWKYWYRRGLPATFAADVTTKVRVFVDDQDDKRVSFLRFTDEHDHVVLLPVTGDASLQHRWVTCTSR